MPIVRDTRGRFARAARKLNDGEYKPDPNIWVRFSLTTSYKGCGNKTISAMETAPSNKEGHSPFATTGTYGYAEGTPGGGIRLSEVIAYLKKWATGREIDITFAHYPYHGAEEKKYGNKGVKYTNNFKAGELLELLEHTPEAKRVNDWFNTNHRPPSHLRSYSIVFHANGLDVPQDFLEMKK